MSEHDEQVYLFQWVDTMKASIPALNWIHANPNGGLRNKITAAKMKAEGQKKGVPDIYLMSPKGNYHGLAIEMKFGKNKVTPEQEQWLAHLQDVGYMTAVCYSWVEAKNTILFYLEETCQP